MKLTNWQRIGFPAYTETYRPGGMVLQISGVIYALGGSTPSGSVNIDLNTSTNITGWTMIGQADYDTHRHFFGATYHSGKFWVAGGTDGNDVFDDVWNSTDFVNWTLVSTGNIWGLRQGHTLDSFNNKLVLIGGYSGVYGSGSYKDDIYDSSDGITWTKKTQTLSAARRFHTTICTGDKYLWIMGGETASGVYTNEYHKLYPFIGDYSKKTETPPWCARAGVGLCYDSSNIYVMGGITATGALNDIRGLDKTYDGEAWVNMTPNPSYTHRGFAYCLVYNSGVYLLGGITNASGAFQYNGNVRNPCPGQYIDYLANTITPLYIGHIVTVSGGIINNWIKDYNAPSGDLEDNYIKYYMPATPNTHTIDISGGLIKNWTVNASGTRTTHNHSINISGGLVKSWTIT